MQRVLKLFWILLVGSVITIIIYYFIPEKKLSSTQKIDKILVLKSKRQMTVFWRKKKLKTYTISLGENPKGHKQFEGDEKTPDGIYRITEKRKKSAYYKGLLISYPNARDKQFAETLNKSPGGGILIHSLPVKWHWLGKFHRWTDWTNGCIAVTSDEIDELFDAIEPQTLIEIRE
jgi:murein L,D-transpeptidase YafK